MDPALERLIEEGGGDDEVAAIVRLARPDVALLAGVRVVASFGEIHTVRVARRMLPMLRATEGVVSVKAPRRYAGEDALLSDIEPDVEPEDVRRPEGLAETGRGTVVAVVDWGLDFTHPAFRDDVGRTRLIALWDQQPGSDPAAPNRFGYGRIHSRTAIDAALLAEDPFAALGYDPTLADPGGGTHGTATTSVAAGSAWPGGVAGVAPEAELLFVHLSTWGPSGPQNLGDSVALAEAIAFIRETAGARPCAVNLSMGRCAGPHDGSTSLERLFDIAMTGERPLLIAQSGGNYFDDRTHAELDVPARGTVRLPFEIHPGARGIRELDLWYAGGDRLLVGVEAPGGAGKVMARPGAGAVLRLDGRPVARLQSRLHDPNNGRNEVVLRIHPSAPAGLWHAVVVGARVTDGHVHAWIERESGSRRSSFPDDVVVTTATTGSIANGRRTVSVGAYDAHDPERRLARFSSSGSTVDGRAKPDLIAPGRDVLVARSRPPGLTPGADAPLATRTSGTSMAAPFVAGTLACMLQATGGTWRPDHLTASLLGSCEPYPWPSAGRAGAGYLDIEAALERVGGARPVVLAPASMPAEATPDETARRPRSTAAGSSTSEPAAAATDDPAGPDELLRRLAVADARQLYRALVLLPGSMAELEQRVQAVALPNDRAQELRARDLFVRVAPGERRGLLAVLVSGELVDRRTAERRGWQVEGTLPGRFAHLIEGGPRPRARDELWARRIAGPDGYLPAGHAILRLTDAPSEPRSEATDLVETIGLGHSCLPGEGPPAPEPDQTGRGPHPLVDRRGTAERSRRPSVGYAQQCLNEFLARHGAGNHVCADSSPQARAYVAAAIRSLAAQGQVPLVVDCRFGAMTDTATRAFQACSGIARDGQIGPITWPLLDALATPEPPVLPTPDPPGRPVGPAATGHRRWFIRSRPVWADTAVEPFHRAPALWARMKDDMAATTGETGGFIYLVGLDMGWDTPMDAQGTKLWDVLVDASARGVAIRVMLQSAFGDAVVPAINALPHAGAILDNRRTAAHHQKLLVVKRPDGIVAYCGGTDIEKQRIPWHDLHARLTGPAVEDVQLTFVQRWRDHPGNRGIQVESPTPQGGVAGTPRVQLTRTFGKAGYGFAPRGEFTIYEAVKHAIGQTREFIYLEDQYLVANRPLAIGPAISTLLAAKLAEPSFKLLVILIARTECLNSVGELGGQGWHRRRKFIEELRRAAAGKVVVCQYKITDPGGRVTYATPTFVHSKTWIFDDEFAFFGSANVETKGYTNNSEANIGIADPNADGDRLSFAHRLRMDLWMKHLNPPGSTVVQERQIADPLAGAGFWRRPPALSPIEPYDVNGHLRAPRGERDTVTRNHDAAWDIFDSDGSR